MASCPKCSATLSNDAVFCPECGTSVPRDNNTQYPQSSQYQPQQPQYQSQTVMGGMQQPYPVSAYSQNVINENMLPNEYKPVSIGAYVGYSILFSLPLIGWIMVFVIGFGSGYCKSLRNFAKAALIIKAVKLALEIGALIIMLITPSFMTAILGEAASMTEGFYY